MEDIFEQLYYKYIILLNNLNIGYDMNLSDLEEIWDLINLLDFVYEGHPTEDEFLWIADHYELPYRVEDYTNY